MAIGVHTVVLAQPRGPAPRASASAAPAAAPAPRPKPLADSLPPDVRVQYEAGKILFQDGDYATALLKFQGAYAKTKEPRLLWNIAVCQKNLRHYAKTLDVLRQYLDEGGALLTAEDRQEATDLIKAIEPFTTSLTVKVSEEGAEVFVDDEPLGSSPIAKPIVTDIGSRRFRAKKDGFRVFEKEIPVGGSVGAVVELKLERQGGKLELRVRADATVFLDDKEIGRGPLVQIDSPIGGHALRITAPKMRTYQGEVVIEDGKTRNLEIVLEPDLEHIAEIRVAVGCTNPEPFTPEQGLTIFLDGSAESASPLGVRKRIVEGTERIAFVPFTVTPGHHSVRVRIPGCESLVSELNAEPSKPAVVNGMLAPENPWFNGSPAGSPNGWRVSAGYFTTTTTFANFEAFYQGRVKPLVPLGSVDVAIGGPSATVGLQSRWLTALFDMRYLVGSTTGSVSGIGSDGPRVTFGPTSLDASFTQLEAALRFGPRIPLYLAAISGGISGQAGRYTSSVAVGADRAGFVGGAGFWAALDVQPLCDWGIQGGWMHSWVGYTKSGGDDVSATGTTALFLHAVYEPNRICDRKRGGQYRLDGGAP